MLRHHQHRQRGAWKINTAQTLILLIAIGSAFAVYDAYQKANAPPPPPITSVTPPVRDPRQARYAEQVAAWQAKLSQLQMTVTWPYLGHDYVARVDLPDKVPITLADWDESGEEQAAVRVYKGFVQVRRQAKVAMPETCIVHVFDSTGAEVAQASASGVVTSASQPIGTEQ